MMPTAKEIRARAWTRLGEGAWSRAIAGFALIFILGALMQMLLRRIGLEQGWIHNLPLVEVAASVLPPGTVFPPGLESIAVDKYEFWYQVVTFWVQTSWAGILGFGGAVLTISVNRGGPNVQQTLCGFSRPFKTSGLALLTTIYTTLWGLLLVVPGFYAFYSYRMAFYLLADHPEWSISRAISESKKMMYGHRWRLACLDASFIGWYVLTLCTMGLGRIIVDPYASTAFAAFYEDLLDRSDSVGEPVVQNETATGEGECGA